MLEKINELINYLGFWNFFNLIVLIFTTVLAFYLYFKTFYRLVYSTERICKTCDGLIDWQNEFTIFTTRVLCLNNGRKTITKDEIKKFLIKSSKHIFDIKTLREVEGLKINTIQNNVSIEFTNMDSSEFFLLEIEHSGDLIVEGRIAESGKILYTETKTWLIINVVFIALFFVNMFYNVYAYMQPEKENLKLFGLNFIMFFVIFMVLRYIHKIFFIPDSISAKYLDSKDKWNREFKNEF